MTIHAELIAEIKTFLATHGISATGFGKAALNDKSFLPRLIKRKSANTKTVERVQKFMRGYKPPKRKPVDAR